MFFWSGLCSLGWRSLGAEGVEDISGCAASTVRRGVGWHRRRAGCGPDETFARLDERIPSQFDRFHPLRFGPNRGAGPPQQEGLFLETPGIGDDAARMQDGRDKVWVTERGVDQYVRAGKGDSMVGTGGDESGVGEKDHGVADLMKGRDDGAQPFGSPD